MLSSFIHPHAVPHLYYLFSFAEHKSRYLEKQVHWKSMGSKITLLNSTYFSKHLLRVPQNEENHIGLEQYESEGDIHPLKYIFHSRSVHEKTESLLFPFHLNDWISVINEQPACSFFTLGKLAISVKHSKCNLTRQVHLGFSPFTDSFF